MPESCLQESGKTAVAVRHVAGLRVWARDEQDGPVRIDVIDTALRVVFGDEDRHAVPGRRGGEIFDDASEREVVVGDEGRLVRVSVLGAFLVRVIVGQVNEQEPREGLFAHLRDELVYPVLIGDVHVEAGVDARGVAVQRIGHGNVGEQPRPGGLSPAPSSLPASSKPSP